MELVLLKPRPQPSMRSRAFLRPVSHKRPSQIPSAHLRLCSSFGGFTAEPTSAIKQMIKKSRLMRIYGIMAQRAVRAGLHGAPL